MNKALLSNKPIEKAVPANILAMRDKLDSGKVLSTKECSTLQKWAYRHMKPEFQLKCARILFPMAGILDPEPPNPEKPDEAPHLWSVPDSNPLFAGGNVSDGLDSMVAFAEFMRSGMEDSGAHVALGVLCDALRVLRTSVEGYRAEYEAWTESQKPQEGRPA
ncbi:MAG: hypothetical protein JWN13_3315 [Betaproteobacteria bacterium]|jgi:hypothetical protein|nr:hypothetical protein [Betaproteobacteria bacterium]